MPVVVIEEGCAITTSRDVAAFFGKRHDDVLKAIENLLSQIGENANRNFAVSSYSNNLANGRSYKQYEMDRDGFTLLAMGFTGSEALKVKLAYMAEFNRMEAALRVAPPPAAQKTNGSPSAFSV